MTTLPPTCVSVTERLTKLVESLLETGVAYWDDGVQNWPERRNRLSLISENFVRPFAKACAKEANRPFIFACHTVYNEGTDTGVDKQHHSVSLLVPRQRRTEKLVANLLLLDTKRVYSKWSVRHGRELSAITSHHNSTTWNFFFKGEEGMELFEKWRANLLTDNDIRWVLKLPRLK